MSPVACQHWYRGLIHSIETMQQQAKFESKLMFLSCLDVLTERPTNLWSTSSHSMQLSKDAGLTLCYRQPEAGRVVAVFCSVRTGVLNCLTGPKHFQNLSPNKECK